MTIEQNPGTQKDIPDTMSYTEADKALARQKIEEARIAKEQAAKAELARKRTRRRRIGLAVAGFVVAPPLAGTGWFVGNLLTADDSTEPQREPGASAPVDPGSEASNPTPETGEGELSPAEQREAMYYALESDYFVDDAYYEQVQPGTGEGPVGGPDASQYINQAVATEAINGVLHNITMATETGNSDAILAAYAQTSPNEFGESQDEVDQIITRSELIQAFTEQYPDYPLSNLELQEVERVSPDPTDKDKVSVIFKVMVTSYGNYTPGQDIVEFKTLDTWSWNMERAEIEGWSDGGSTVSWVVTHTSSSDSEVIQ